MAEPDAEGLSSLFEAGLLLDRALQRVEEAASSQLPVEEDGCFKAPDGSRLRPLLPDSTAEDRQQQFIQRHMRELADGLGDDVWRWSFLPDGEGLLLLQDPLLPSTRASRRNLLVLTVSAVLVALTGEVPKRIPGLEFDLGNQSKSVMGVLCLVLLVQLAFFCVYAWGDSRSNYNAARQAVGTVRLLEGFAARFRVNGDRVLSCCMDLDLQKRVRALLRHFRSMVPIAAAEQAGLRWPGVLRRWVDFLLPVMAAGFGVVVLGARLFERWELWPLALTLPALSIVYFARRPARAVWSRHVTRRLALRRARVRRG